MTSICAQIVIYQRLFSWKIARDSHSAELTWKVGHLLASLELWKTYRTVWRILTTWCLLAIWVFLFLCKRLENPSEVVLQAIESLFGKAARVNKPSLQETWISAEITREAEKEEASDKKNVEYSDDGDKGDKADECPCFSVLALRFFSWD